MLALIELGADVPPFCIWDEGKICKVLELNGVVQVPRNRVAQAPDMLPYINMAKYKLMSEAMRICNAEIHVDDMVVSILGVFEYNAFVAAWQPEGLDDFLGQTSPSTIPAFDPNNVIVGWDEVNRAWIRGSESIAAPQSETPPRTRANCNRCGQIDDIDVFCEEPVGHKGLHQSLMYGMLFKWGINDGLW